jgi:dTDP-4-amino-4,6-dideoxygalactose transaminase
MRCSTGASAANDKPETTNYKLPSASLGHKPGAFLESEKAANETLALPVCPELIGDQARYVVEAVRRFGDAAPGR